MAQIILYTSDSAQTPTTLLYSQNKPDLSTRIGRDSRISIPHRRIQGGRIAHHAFNQRQMQPLALSLQWTDSPRFVPACKWFRPFEEPISLCCKRSWCTDSRQDLSSRKNKNRTHRIRRIDDDDIELINLVFDEQCSIHKKLDHRICAKLPIPSGDRRRRQPSRLWNTSWRHPQHPRRFRTSRCVRRRGVSPPHEEHPHLPLRRSAPSLEMGNSSVHSLGYDEQTTVNELSFPDKRTHLAP